MQSFSTVASSLIRIDRVLQRKVRCHFIQLSFFSTKVRKLCTTSRALIRLVNSLKKYEHNNFGSDLSIDVLNDHKPILPVSPRKATCLPKQFSTQMQSTKLKKLRIIYTKGNIFGSCYKKSFSFQEKLQLNNVKHKQLPPQVVFATLTHDDQTKLKPVHCLVKHLTVLTSL